MTRLARAGNNGGCAATGELEADAFPASIPRKAMCPKPTPHCWSIRRRLILHGSITLLPLESRRVMVASIDVHELVAGYQRLVKGGPKLELPLLHRLLPGCLQLCPNAFEKLDALSHLPRSRLPSKKIPVR